MKRVLAIMRAILLELHLALKVASILGGRVVLPITLGALERNLLDNFPLGFGHEVLPMISAWRSPNIQQFRRRVNNAGG
jgi:hypothetical protein